MTTARILVPPGIGDIYWVFVKLRGFMADKGIERAEIWIDAPDDKRRSLGFVERVPFVEAGGYFDRRSVDPRPEGHLSGWKARAARKEAYTRDARHAFPDIDGFDWFISFNGSVDAGRSLDEIEPQWPANWDLGLIETHRDRAFGARAVEKHGDYVVAAFFDHGMYRKWLRDIDADAISGILRRIADATGHRIVLVGAKWDLSPLNRALLDAGGDYLVSEIGNTTIGDYFGMLRRAKGCIGFPAGNTMMGAILGIPTVLIWNRHFAEGMWTNALPPNSPHYLPLDSALGGEAIAERAAQHLVTQTV